MNMSKLRVNRLREAMRRHNIDSFFISRLSDIKWLSGYTGSTAYIFITADNAVFITDGRYETQCRQSLDSFWQLHIAKNYQETFASLGKQGRKITVQPVLEVAMYHTIATAKPAGLELEVDMEDILLQLRMVKDVSEIALIKDEYDRAGRAFLNALEDWQFDQSESAWAARLEYCMALLGATGPSFETIVASGIRGALPHGVASDKLINSADAVTIDFGSRSLYNSDYTRVVYSGNDSEILKIIDIVRVALESAIECVKPGVKCADIDKVARDYIDSKGFGEYFNHGLGHGVGMDVHEQPYISARGKNIVEEGMVFTIEPGIYLPDRFGIRLEQTVAVTAGGCEILSTMLDRYVYKL